MGTPMAGIDADVWVVANPSTALGSPEGMTDSGDLTTYVAATHVYWDKTVTTTVQNCPTATAVSTQNTASITAGSGVVVTPVTGTLMTSIAVGSRLSIAAGGGTAEVVTVTAKSGSTFTATFAFNHNANTAITTVFVTVTDYTFQWAIGKVVFNTARVAGTNNFVQISAGSWYATTQLDAANDWTLSLKAAIVKTTAFQQANRWEDKTVTIKSGSGKISSFRTDDRMSKEIGNLLAFTLYASKTNNYRWQFLGRVTGVEPKSTVAGVIEQAISFDIEEVAYFLIV